MTTNDDSMVLELRSHYRLKDKPVRTLEVLRVFLPREAQATYEALRRGEVVAVRRGTRAALEQLASSMEAQGFEVAVRPAAAG
ncbi:MAG: hypothetical protein K0M64_09340 [Rhizobium sp.]|nr:hypothetical protein [Rhizobium sp.]